MLTNCYWRSNNRDFVSGIFSETGFNHPHYMLIQIDEKQESSLRITGNHTLSERLGDGGFVAKTPAENSRKRL